MSSAFVGKLLAIGSSIISGIANRVLYLDSSGKLSQSANLTYTETLTGFSYPEYALGNQATIARSVGVGVDTTLNQNLFYAADSLTASDDGTANYYGTRNELRISGTTDGTVSIASVVYCGNANTLYNNATHTVKGTSDTSVVYYGAYNNVNASNISVPVSGDAPSIFIYGAFNVAYCQVTKGAGATPYISLVGVEAQAQRNGGAIPDVCVGVNAKATLGTLNYGVKAKGATAALYSDGPLQIVDGNGIVLGTTTGTKIGTSTSQKLSFWNATPIVQPTTAIAGATFVAGAGTAVNDASTFDGYTLKQVVKALRNAGLLA